MIIPLGLWSNGLAVSPESAKEFCFELQAPVTASILFGKACTVIALYIFSFRRKMMKITDKACPGNKIRLLFLVLLFLGASLVLRPHAYSVIPKTFVEPTAAIYDYVVETSWLTTKDQVPLSVTYFKPVPRFENEKFPVLFEFLPYRKDDPVSMTEDPNYAYFAKRGFIMAKVDIRGTGSSEGIFPLREYSEHELDDAVDLIDQLSQMPGSNGRVGMWGISWGGFNAIQVAMRQPPALKAILAAHATDDLYHDDIHYIDGAFHVDPWATWFDHSKALPQTPLWQLDDAFFRDRFSAYPGILTYLKQQVDGEFWRRNSLRWQYDKIRVPVYIIGGLLDGYRDTLPRLLENMTIPVKGVIGPWNHDYPAYGVPGPNYEWRHEAVCWWDYWLKGRDTGVLEDPSFTVFVRNGHGPDAELKMTPGHWICEEWPIKGTRWRKLFPNGNRQLLDQTDKEALETLRYIPGYGAMTTGTTLPSQVNWWGDPTGDIRPDDAGSLVFDSPVLEESFSIIGFPKVRLRVSADAPLAHWVARLEDVQPDGTVSLVTGALINGAQRQTRLSPEPLVPGEIYNLDFELHFTTWTFHPGHRIRLAVSNALFPMIWPTPYTMTTKLFLGTEETRLELPAIPEKEYKTPDFKPPEPKEESKAPKPVLSNEFGETGKNFPYLGCYSWPKSYEQKRDLQGNVSVEWKESSSAEYPYRRMRYYQKDYYQTNDKNPTLTKYHGEVGTRVEFEARTLDLRTTFDIHSDDKNFYLRIVQSIFENSILVREREWQETIEWMLQ